MSFHRHDRKTLAGKTLDIHTHAGISLKAYACQEYPYAATIEGQYYRQKAGGVDVSVVFPFTPDLYFEPRELAKGQNIPAAAPLSPVPYAVENELLLREIFEFCPEHQERFLPFVSLDPMRDVRGQVRALKDLAQRFPIYGIKVNPVLCQSRITGLLEEGRAFVDLAREHHWPFLFHTTPDKNEGYSNADMSLQVAERYPDVRFCLAHCICFHEGYLRRANALPNVWIDTAALKIQVQMVHDRYPLVQPFLTEVVKANYANHGEVLRTLVEMFPNRIVWGSDSPAYAYICRRKQAEGVFAEFRLKGCYEDEVVALRSLPRPLQMEIAGRNSLAFLFGPEQPLTKSSQG